MQTNLPSNIGVKIGSRSMMAFNLLAIISENKRFVTLPTCASKLNCSVSYLEEISKVLKRNKFVSSRKGPSGGFLLAMEPHEITVGKVISAMEGAHKLETDVTKAMSEIIMFPLYGKSLSDVLKRAKKK